MIQQIDAAHAQLMEAYISRAQSEDYEVLGVELPWSFYGARGVLDAALRSRGLVNSKRIIILAEFKTQIVDVGRCIRQVQLVRKYFMRSTGRLAFLSGKEPCEIQCPLIVKATVENVKQVVRYHHLFRDVDVVFFHEDESVAAKMHSQYEIRLAMKQHYGTV